MPTSKTIMIGARVRFAKQKGAPQLLMIKEVEARLGAGPYAVERVSSHGGPEFYHLAGMPDTGFSAEWFK